MSSITVLDYRCRVEAAARTDRSTIGRCHCSTREHHRPACSLFVLVEARYIAGHSSEGLMR